MPTTITGSDISTEEISGTLFVDSANNRIGVGTSDPDNSLHVFSGSDGEIAQFTGAVKNRGLHVETTASPDESGHSILNSKSDGSDGILSFQIDGSERVRIDSSGNVGINKSDPQSNLDVNNDFERINATFTAGSSVDISLPQTRAILLLIKLRNADSNSNFNFSAMGLFNTRAPSFGGGQFNLLHTAQGSTGTPNELSNVNITSSNSRTLNVAASVVSGAGDTIAVNIRQIAI